MVDVELVGERAGVGLVEVDVLVVEVELRVLVAGLVGDQVEDVGVAVPSSQRRETPVLGDGGDGRVVVVEGVVDGSLEVVGDGTAEEDGEDLVGDTVGLVLVEGQQDQGVVHEVLVAEERGHEVALPGGAEGDVGVVGVVGHVGGEESPLRQGLGVQVGLEVVEALDLAETSGVVGDGLVEDQGVVLAHVVVGVRLLVGRVVEALEARVGEAFLVLGPRDALGVEQVHDGGHVGGDDVEVVVVHAEVVTTRCGAVVGLGRVSGGEEVAQGDTLGGEPCHVWVAGGTLVVNVLQPDLVEAVEGEAFDIAHGRQWLDCGSSRLDGRV